jgi:D-sedoheptulose 7-phosphate isomerase
MDWIECIKGQLLESARVKQQLAAELVPAILEVTEVIRNCLMNRGKILFCGNGGSAADAQHLAAELVVRLKIKRRALPALALNTNSSVLTAIANDDDFSRIFVRQLEAFATPGDVVIGLSTSGNSENVVAAIQFAHELGCTTVALTGQNGGRLAAIADYILPVPSIEVQRIQEAHITLGHIICELVEQSFAAD